MSDARHAETIANRLSLRAPQRESLAILSRVGEILRLEKSPDLAGALAAIQAEFGHVTSFDREFPSLCFALATGVGKTRLMGAFIAWLHRAKGIRNFFVLAPNLTIYEKLVLDFTPSAPKYVLTGLAEFATEPPVVITGDDYAQGRGVRDTSRAGRQLNIMGVGGGGPVHVNIFNIAKINEKGQGSDVPRIRRLAECIGESYFQYLSELPDLVLLMDESHRYRATAGVRAINELKPVLGLELTATPWVERGTRREPFGNVVYAYGLPNAMADELVKEPAVATRQDFQASDYDEAGLERLKLEDGLRIHELTKGELDTYARNHGVRRVKPFVLVVASDTTHAEALRALIESDGFFDGHYRGKVITVHSKQGAEERDEVVEELLSVEDPENQTEIVIHVDKLKEGWDVTNLYTIIPLRAANSRTLVEQSIGRGLRLPYGRRVGVDGVDRLTIVAHDRFQEIVDHANDPNSIIRRQIVIGRDIPLGPTRVDVVPPTIVTRLFAPPSGEAPPPHAVQRPLFSTPRQEEVARKVIELLPEWERLPSSKDLLDPAVQAKLVERVLESLPPKQGDYTEEPVDHGAIVRSTVETYIALSIDIPRVRVAPRADRLGHDASRGSFVVFPLDLSSVRPLPATKDILIRHLEENRQYTLAGGDGVIAEDMLEKYLVRGLVEFDDVSYDDHAEVLFALASQVVQHLRSYLTSEDEVTNVLQYHGRSLAELIHAQMQEHYVPAPVEFDVVVSKGFRTLRENVYTLAKDEQVRDFRAPIAERQRMRQMVFGGFKKSVYPRQRFESDSERRFAVVLENDERVEKWLKPVETQLFIDLPDGSGYLPDFVVETAERKFLCEVKAANEMDSDDVEVKARAAVVWCAHASAHAAEHGTKPWAYLLVPHDVIGDQRTFASLVAEHSLSPDGATPVRRPS